MKEIKRTCKNCGKEWFSDFKEETLLVHQSRYEWQVNVLLSPESNQLRMNRESERVQEVNDKLDKLHKCPNCLSKNYEEEYLDDGKKFSPEETAEQKKDLQEKFAKVDKDSNFSTGCIVAIIIIVLFFLCFVLPQTCE